MIYVCSLVMFLAFMTGLVMEKKYQSDFCWIPYGISVVSLIIGLTGGDLKEIAALVLCLMVGVFALVVMLYLYVNRKWRCN